MAQAPATTAVALVQATRVDHPTEAHLAATATRVAHTAATATKVWAATAAAMILAAEATDQAARVAPGI